MKMPYITNQHMNTTLHMLTYGLATAIFVSLSSDDSETMSI